MQSRNTEINVCFKDCSGKVNLPSPYPKMAVKWLYYPQSSENDQTVSITQNWNQQPLHVSFLVVTDS